MVRQLNTYKKKRALKVTPEPGAVLKPRSQGALIFVVQKHKAGRLHYDFRLECDGVLLSWAVPKGPSINPHEKRLAVMVEDHPFDYRNFEGIIPAGHYGAGTVMIWDNGTYYPTGAEDVDESSGENCTNLEEMQHLVRQSLRRGKLSFVLKGKKLRGQWALMRMKGNPKQWLLIKHDDAYAKKR